MTLCNTQCHDLFLCIHHQGHFRSNLKTLKEHFALTVTLPDWPSEVDRCICNRLQCMKQNIQNGFYFSPHLIPNQSGFRNRLKFYFVHSFIDLHLLNPITPIKFLKGHKCLGSLCVPKSQGSPFELSAYSVWTARNMWLMILNIFIGHNNKYSLISEDKLVLCISNHLQTFGSKMEL